MAGAAFLVIGAFHTSIWFDESYSVAIATHTFAQIWTIGACDVHPVLYYWMLHVLYLVFGTNLTVYRLFSVLGAISLGVLGYTHVRGDVNARTGLLFSLFALSIPAVAYYGLEIRMYSWVTFTVMVTFLYALRIIRSAPGAERGSGGARDATAFARPRIRTWVMYSLASLASAYLHYYGLLAALVVGLALVVFLVRNRRARRADLVCLIVSAFIQIALYLPWIMNFLGQLAYVSGGFWITFEFPESVYELVGYPLTGMLAPWLGFVGTCLVLVVLLAAWLRRRRHAPLARNPAGETHPCRAASRRDTLPAMAGLALYLCVFLVASLASALLGSLLLYDRYLFVAIGPLLLSLSWVLANEDGRIMRAVVAIVLTFSLANEVVLVTTDYSAQNKAPLDYLAANLEPGDIIIYSNIGTGGVVAVTFSDVHQYFLNPYTTAEAQAYQAFAPQMDITYNWSDVLDGYTGRIWVVGDSSLSELDGVLDIRGTSLISSETFQAPYETLDYGISLVEKSG